MTRSGKRRQAKPGGCDEPPGFRSLVARAAELVPAAIVVAAGVARLPILTRLAAVLAVLALVVALLALLRRFFLLRRASLLAFRLLELEGHLMGDLLTQGRVTPAAGECERALQRTSQRFADAGARGLRRHLLLE